MMVFPALFEKEKGGVFLAFHSPKTTAHILPIDPGKNMTSHEVRCHAQA